MEDPSRFDFLKLWSPGDQHIALKPFTDMNTQFKHMDPAYYDASASLLIQSEPALALIKNPIAKALLQDFAKISKLEPCSIVSPFVRPVFAELTKAVEQRVCHQFATMQCSDPLVSLRLRVVGWPSGQKTLMFDIAIHKLGVRY